MASSLISNNHHIDFDAVFRMEDTDLVKMFESLIEIGLKNFLGCPAVFNEAALTEFFANSSVREDGLVVSTMNGVTVEISEIVFATTFELPVEGLTDLSEVPKNLVFDARSLFSISKEQVSISCLNKAMKIQYLLLHDILAKTIYVKASSFDSVTRDRFMLMTAITFDVKINWSSLLFGVLREMVTPGSRQAKGYAIQICVLLRNVPGLELGESKTFPIHGVLNEKTVHRYVVINDKLGGEEVVDAPKVKRTPAKKKGVTKKRPAAGDAEVAPIVKKKRTTKGKPVAAKRLPVEEPIGVSTTSEQPVAEPVTGEREPVAPIVKKKRTTKGKPVAAKRLPVEEPIGVSTTSEQPVAEPVTGEREPVGGLRIASITEATTGDADAAIEQVLAQLDLVIKDSYVERGDRIETWFDRAFVEEFATADQENQDSEDEIDFDVDNQELLVFDETRTVPEAGGSKSFGDDKAGEKAIGSTHSTEEHMSIDDLLMQISKDMMLPSIAAAEITKIRPGESINIHEVQERDLYYASLPRISIHDKGKEILEEDEPVRGNPAREMVELICGYVDFLVQLRDRVMKDVVEFFHSFSLNKLSNLDSLKILKEKDKLMLEWAETDSLEMAIRRRVYILAKYRELLLRKFLESHRKYLVPRQPWIAIVSQIIDLLSAAHSKSLKFALGPVVSTNALEEKLYYVESPESPPPIPQRQESSSSSSDSQMNFDSNDIPLDETTEAQTSLPAAPVDLSPLLDYLKTSLSYLIQGARQEGKNNDDLQILRLNELKKIVMAQGVTADTDSLAVSNRFNVLDAKILLLDGQVAEVNREGTSRGPQPSPVDQNRGSGSGNTGGVSTLRPSDIIEGIIDTDRHASAEDSLRAESERDKARRERRLSRSGAYKRRRGY
ncbi:hypothetical protein F511_01701 [Dorcoceras hygrometricum]|nr:hypothetical protein F511_01701 [Dorcoceras hygrometricum]